MTQRRQASRDSLHALDVSDWLHSRDGRDFLGIGLDATLGNDIAQEHASRHAENTLLGVELDLVGA